MGIDFNNFCSKTGGREKGEGGRGKGEGGRGSVRGRGRWIWRVRG